MEVEERHDWRQGAETVRQIIDELRICFANISASAQSLIAKVQQNGESSLKGDVEEIIQLAKSMEEKLSCFSRACELLAETSPTEFQNLTGGKTARLCGVRVSEVQCRAGRRPGHND